MEKDNLLYDLKKNPMVYFTPMLYIMEQLESQNVKLCNVFPVTSSHIPGSISIDTTSLAGLFHIQYGRSRGVALSDSHKIIWNTIFRLKRKEFKSFKGKGDNPQAPKQYVFANIIKTDGYSVSILHRRVDLLTAVDRHGIPIDKNLGQTQNEEENDDENDDAVDSDSLSVSSAGANEIEAAAAAESEAAKDLEVLLKLNRLFSDSDNEWLQLGVLLNEINTNISFHDVKKSLKSLENSKLIEIAEDNRVNANELYIRSGVPLNVARINNIPINLSFLKGEKLKNTKFKWIKKRLPKIKRQEIEYLDEIVKNELLVELWKLNLIDRVIVGIDPGKINMITCVNGMGKDSLTFRYTQLQRAKELNTKAFNKFRKKKKMNSGLNLQVYEDNLSKENSKSLNFNDYKRYFDKKMKYIDIAKEFYGDAVFRRLSYQTYINKRKSESRMINNFKKLYGGPDKVVIAIGDWEQKKQMKFRPPSLGKGIRKIFRRNGYMIFMVDEFRTSMWCCSCGEKNEQFMYHRNKKKKPKQEDIDKGYKKPLRKKVLSRGLIRCTNEECRIHWDRDINAAKNIYYLAYLILLGLERPDYLSRSRNENI